MTPTIALAFSGFAGGLAFGWIGFKTNFCVAGAVSDIALARDWRRLRAWLLAIATALAATESLRLAGLVRLDGAAALAPGFGWLAALAGGFAFGFGMTLAGGCGQRNLVRMGAGSAKAAAVVLTIALFATLVLAGPLRPIARALGAFANPLAATANQDLAALLGGAAGLAPDALRPPLAYGLAVLLAWLCFKDEWFRRSGAEIAGGVAVGALVAAGFAATSAFAPVPESFNFVVPLGGGAGAFATAAVPGVVIGAFLAAAIPWRVRFEGFTDARDTARNLAGGALMGAGGGLALGCTIGQGVAGVATLALGSLMAWAGIVAGALAGVRYLEGRAA